MKIYDVAVIGGGPAGIIAAFRAGELHKRVILLERNDCLGKKIILTGQGRCNITNAASMETFIERFENQGNFLRTAFSAFFNQELMNFFRARGLELKVERQGRVFPVTDKAYSILKILEACLLETKVNILFKARVLDIEGGNNYFKINVKEKTAIKAKKIILATGGASYKKTGSSGDGFNIARKLGHKIIPLKPALVPLITEESWVKELQGLGLKNVRLIFSYGEKKIISEVGELMFTHFGVSGPLILDLSGKIVSILGKYPKVFLNIDLKPGLKAEQIENKLLNVFKVKGNTQLKNIMKDFLPQRMISHFIGLSGIDPDKIASQITQRERGKIVILFKALPLTIIGSLPLEKAMVTAGGVSIKEINPRTMESMIIPGIYFAGEIIEGCAPSGGYNLQQAFSTGFLAAGSAAKAI